MATPIVAGRVALLLEKKPDLTPDQVKTIMMETAEGRNYGLDVEGRGYVDVRAALDRAAGSTAAESGAKSVGK